MKTPHTVTAVIELGAGLGAAELPLGYGDAASRVPLENPASLTVARVGGAGLFTLGLGCWLARNDTLSPAARGLVAAILLYDVVAAALLAFARIGLGLHGLALWPAVVVHAVMAVWCGAWLRRSFPD